nr:hypothetical protein [Tanacetum cinerariifolium]
IFDTLFVVGGSSPIMPLLDCQSYPRILRRIWGVKGSVSSHTHGWDMSSSSMPKFCFFNIDFHRPPPLSLLFENAFVLCEDVLRGNAFWEWVSFFFNGNPGVVGVWSHSSDSDMSRLILEKTMRVGSGISNMLRERLDLCLLPGSPLKFGVLD